MNFQKEINHFKHLRSIKSFGKGLVFFFSNLNSALLIMQAYYWKVSKSIKTKWQTDMRWSEKVHMHTSKLKILTTNDTFVFILLIRAAKMTRKLHQIRDKRLHTTPIFFHFFLLLWSSVKSEWRIFKDELL